MKSNEENQVYKNNEMTIISALNEMWATVLPQLSSCVSDYGASNADFEPEMYKSSSSQEKSPQPSKGKISIY